MLHDIGHYPYSHWIEELGKLPNTLTIKSHEERAKDIILTSELKEILKDDWGLDIDFLVNIIKYHAIPDNQRFLCSFLHSVIDVDKIDYLIRDSIHCGVKYGNGIDIDRLLDSLYYNDEDNFLGVTDKGRSVLLGILATRNIMYQEIYWHKTVRSCNAMFKDFFMNILKNLFILIISLMIF